MPEERLVVVGSGAGEARELESIVREVAANLGYAVPVAVVSERQEISAMGIRCTPALVVNGRVRVVGRMPTRDEVRDMLIAQPGLRT